MTARQFKSLPTRVQNALFNEIRSLGIKILDRRSITPKLVAANFTARDLLKLPNCGETSVRAIDDWLAEAGLHLRNYRRPPPSISGEYFGA